MKMMMAGAVLAAGMLSGCATQLSTLPDRDVTAANQALQGVVYSLPMLQYKLDVTRTMTGCPDSVSSVLEYGKRKIHLTQGDLKFEIKAEAAERYVAGERYTVDYEGLRAPFTTAGFSIEPYPSGALKAINVSADDHSAEAIKDAVSIGLAIASLSSGGVGVGAVAAAGAIPTGPGLSAPEISLDERPSRSQRTALKQKAILDLMGRVRSEKMVTCTDEAAKLLTDSKKNSDDQETKQKELKSATADVTRLTLVANLRRSGPQDVRALDRALTRQNKANAELEALKDAGKKLDAKLTITQSLYWPQVFEDRDRSLPLPADATAKFSALLEPRDVSVLKAKDISEWLASLDPRIAEDFRKDKRFKDYVGKPKEPSAEELKTAAGIACRDARGDGTVAIADAVANCVALRLAPRDADCRGANSKVEACMKGKLDLYVSLAAAPTGLPPCIGDASAECAKQVTIDEANELRGSNFQPRPSTSPTPPPQPLTGPLGRLARDGAPDPGVFIRTPAEGETRICQGLTVVGCDAWPTIYRSKQPIAAPQLGQLRYLPFRNDTFEASQLSLLLRVDGSLEKFEYKRTRAAGQAAAAAAADAVSQYKTYRDERDAARKSAREEEIAKLQYQIDLIAKKKELIKAEAPEPVDPVDPLKGVRDETVRLDTETALLNARLAQLQAAAALAAAPAS